MSLNRASVRGTLVRTITAVSTSLILFSAANTKAQASIAIDNFARVDANYFRGAQPAGRDFRDLAALGIKTIINLTSFDAQANEPSMVAAAGMKYVAIPMTTRTVPTQDQIAEFLKIINDPTSQPVYVHCVGGSHRTGVMTALYRITHDGWTGKRAFAEMKNFKFGPDFLHSEFKKFVLDYQAGATTGLTATTKAVS
jgi:protein tyrosine/serine phosphatase